MNNEMLQEIAGVVLSQLIGPGRWCKDRERPRFEKITNPILGLAEGDVVYTYDEDDEEMQECKVLAVVDGVGYVLWSTSYHGPLLMPVANDSYGRTMAEAAEVNREQIESDIRYAQERYDRLSKVKQVLGQ